MADPYFWEAACGGGVQGMTDDSVDAPFLSRSFAHIAAGIRYYF